MVGFNISRSFPSVTFLSKKDHLTAELSTSISSEEVLRYYNNIKPPFLVRFQSLFTRKHLMLWLKGLVVSWWGPMNMKQKSNIQIDWLHSDAVSVNGPFSCNHEAALLRCAGNSLTLTCSQKTTVITSFLDTPTTADSILAQGKVCVCMCVWQSIGRRREEAMQEAEIVTMVTLGQHPPAPSVEALMVLSCKG